MNKTNYQSVKNEVQQEGYLLNNIGGIFFDEPLSYPPVRRTASLTRLRAKQKELSLIAIKNSPEVFQKLSKHLQDNKDIVLAAVAADPFLIKHASKRLQEDPEIVAAFHTGIDKPEPISEVPVFAAEFASDSEVGPVSSKGAQDAAFRRQKIATLAAVKANPQIFPKLASSLQDDKDIVLALVAKAPLLLKYASKRLQEEPQIVELFHRVIDKTTNTNN